MKSLNREEFSALLKKQRTKLRLSRELRFVPEEIDNWDDLDVLAVETRSRAEGILLVQTDKFFMLPYELRVGLKDTTTGRTKSVICDFCCTWQRGGNSGSITFRRPSDNHSFTFLCCADLRCSLHVRNLTPQATLSRTQLHEDITKEQRIARLKDRLNRVIAILGASPAALDALL